jgi:hypothetical protein
MLPDARKLVMKKFIGKVAVITALGGFAWHSSLDAAPKNADAKKTAPASGSALPQTTEEIVLKDDKGKDRRCKIVESKKLPDGTIQHKLKTLDNGEEMTIIEASPEKARALEKESRNSAPKVAAQAPVANSLPPLPNIPDPMTPLPKSESVKLPKEPTKAPAPSVAPTPEKSQMPVATEGRRGLFGGSRSSASESKPGFFGRLFGRKSSEPTSVAPMPAPVAEPRATAPSRSNPAPVAPAPVAQPVPMNTTPSISGPSLPMPLPKGLPNDNPFSSMSQAPVMPRNQIPTLPTDQGMQSAVYVKSEPMPNYAAGDLRDVMKNDIMPSKREEAAEKLVESALGRRREVREMLVESVKEDPAATVRITCLICLIKTGIRDDLLADALAAAKEDRDGRVRSVVQAMMK